jgi:chemotaxis regulatin CheY-phosphate phosphatase CheZ
MAQTDKTSPPATAADPRRSAFDAFPGAMVNVAQPACAETLPAVVNTLGGIIQATETAAQKVLDETDRLTRHRQQLGRALATLRPMMAYADPTMKAAWNEARAAWDAMAAPTLSLVSAMEFQDLTAQHLSAAIEAVTTLREGLVRCLASISVTAESEAAPVRLAEKLGAPAARATWRQELADQILDDSQRRPALGEPAS